MWGSKKPEPPPKPVAAPLVPPPAKPAGTVASAPASTGTAILEIKQEVAPMNPNEPVRPAGTSGARLGPSLHVKGEITGNEDLHVDGSVEGLISLEDCKLTVGASAKVTADIAAREIVVYGSVKGNLRARDRIEIKKDCSVIGDVATARIQIEDGAYLKGSVETNRGEGQADTEKSAALSARAGRHE